MRRKIGKVVGTLLFGSACVAWLIYLVKTSEDPAGAIADLILLVTAVAIFVAFIAR